MADTPFRLAVLKNLTGLLKTITPANGYKTDLSNFTGDDGTDRTRVFRGRNQFGDRDPVPMVVLLDSPQPADVVPGGITNPNNAGDWPIIIQGFINEDFDNPSDPAFVLSADVRQCLARHKKTNGARPPNLLGMGGRVTKLDIGLGTIRPPEQGLSVKAFFWQVVYLGIVEDLAAPYDWDK